MLFAELQCRLNAKKCIGASFARRRSILDFETDVVEMFEQSGGDDGAEDFGEEFFEHDASPSVEGGVTLLSRFR